MAVRRLVLLLLTLALTAPLPEVHAAALTEAARLSAIYDSILDARFDRAREQLSTACPPAPREACLTLEVAARWWEIVLDLDDRSRDAALQSAAFDAIAAADAWTRREPRRAESWFYLAGAYAPLVQLRVWRGQRLAAAHDGNRIRSALERARALDPMLHDAQFGIGLYHYYADVAPAAAKMLRWLLLLPGGDRQLGLREMIEARQHGALLRGEADFQLHWLYLWYERQPRRALALLQGLQARHPSNPTFLARVAEVQDEYFHDHPASAAAWRTLLARAEARTVAAPELAATRARLGLAVQLDAMAETDRSVELLRRVVDQAPPRPVAAVARAQYLLGRAYDRLGERGRALEMYRSVLAVTTEGDTFDDLRARARDALRTRPNATRAQAYRLSLEGWRALEHGDGSRGAALLARARALAPDDLVIAYRFARARLAEGDVGTARTELERVVQTGIDVPAVVLAAAYLDYGTLLEHANDRSGAIAAYERARAIDGSDPRTHESAEVALKRLAR
ncbi:MAG: tetratricopeptide repeat protein [Vicinamibacterales bacterium]